MCDVTFGSPARFACLVTPSGERAQLPTGRNDERRGDRERHRGGWMRGRGGGGGGEKAAVETRPRVHENRQGVGDGHPRRRSGRRRPGGWVRGARGLGATRAQPPATNC